MKLERSELAGEFTLLRLEGRLDLEGTEEVDLQFSTSATTSRRSVIVDLREVSFLASLGMRMLLTAAKALGHRGLSLVLLAPQDVVRQALGVAGLSQLLLIADDEETAVSLAKGT